MVEVGNATTFDEGGDDWTAMGAQSNTPAPQMMMSQDDGAALDDFAEVLPVSAPQVTIQTASGANQNLDDDLTEEEKEIVRAAAEA